MIIGLRDRTHRPNTRELLFVPPRAAEVRGLVLQEIFGCFETLTHEIDSIVAEVSFHGRRLTKIQELVETCRRDSNPGGGVEPQKKELTREQVEGAFAQASERVSEVQEREAKHLIRTLEGADLSTLSFSSAEVREAFVDAVNESLTILNKRVACTTCGAPSKLKFRRDKTDGNIQYAHKNYKREGESPPPHGGAKSIPTFAIVDPDPDHRKKQP